MRAGTLLDTLREIERGAILTRAFFTVAALARGAVVGSRDRRSSRHRLR